MEEKRQLYNSFLERFPIEKLEEMSLEQYTNLNRDDSFCYWLESITSELGSIWGGSAYKFGIFKHTKEAGKDNGKYEHDEEYSWSARLGKTASEAYDAVRNCIVEIARYARKYNWEKIESIEQKTMWPIVVWKIAYLYSNEQLPPFFNKKDWLIPIAKHLGMANASSSTRAKMYSFIIEKRGDKDIWPFYKELRNIVREQQQNEEQHVWLYAPGEGAKLWDDCLENNRMRLGWDEIEDINKFSSKEEIANRLQNIHARLGSSFMNDSLALWEFANVMQDGDIVYAKKGTNKIIGRGVVQGDYVFDDTLSTFRHVRRINWTHQGEWDYENLVQKTLTDISKYPDFVKTLAELVVNEQENPVLSTDTMQTYSDKEFLDEVFMHGNDLKRLKSLLRMKKNIILQGAPGVGKTFTAERLAFTLMGVKDENRIEKIQFHQNYSYEDFVMGYKPNGSGGFDLRSGTFYKFCKKAQNSPDKDFFFIIDEINRGNLSKIFGELLMLIENSYRGDKHAIKLAYQDEMFAVPENLYIIGMMNTADRSLAMIDYALRRRFCFFDMKPGFTTDGFKAYQNKLASEAMNKIVGGIIALNEIIKNDDSLGEGFCIGHSYFCNQTTDTEGWLENIIEHDIEPMLREYWFDDKDKYNTQINLLRGLLK